MSEINFDSNSTNDPTTGIFTGIGQTRINLLKEVLEHRETSITFDEPTTKTPRQYYIPPMTHPWKKKSFDAFLAKQKHRPEYDQSGAYV